jgi:hypothetical protein
MEESVISPFALFATALLALAIVENSPAATPEATAAAPVEFINDGLAPDNSRLSYKIKINTDKPVKEVNMTLKEMDASGKVVFDGTLPWRNIVHSKQQPIEQGKTYEDYTMFNPGVVKVECSLQEVIFQDDTRWRAPASSPVTPVPARVAESPASKASDAALITQSEAEGFAKTVYHDMGQNDVSKVLGYFDKTVDYYSFGPKDKAFIAEQLKTYFASFPVRLFSVGQVKVQASRTAGKMSVSLEVLYTLRPGSNGAASTGRSEVEWDLVKRDGALKIVRFTGTSYPNPTAPASP